MSADQIPPERITEIEESIEFAEMEGFLVENEIARELFSALTASRAEVQRLTEEARAAATRPTVQNVTFEDGVGMRVSPDGQITIGRQDSGIEIEARLSPSPQPESEKPTTWRTFDWKQGPEGEEITVATESGVYRMVATNEAIHWQKKDDASPQPSTNHDAQDAGEG